MVYTTHIPPIHQHRSTRRLKMHRALRTSGVKVPKANNLRPLQAGRCEKNLKGHISVYVTNMLLLNLVQTQHLIHGGVVINPFVGILKTWVPSGYLT